MTKRVIKTCLCLLILVQASVMLNSMYWGAYMSKIQSHLDRPLSRTREEAIANMRFAAECQGHPYYGVTK